MFEKIVRPFQTREVLATKRIVKSTSVATGERAFLSWGSAGTIPAGALQPVPTPANPNRGGFTLKNAQQVWNQTGTPVTEEVDTGTSAGGAPTGIIVKRVREIVFSSTDVTPTVGSGIGISPDAVSDVVTGLVKSIEGSREIQAKYKTH